MRCPKHGTVCIQSPHLTHLCSYLTLLFVAITATIRLRFDCRSTAIRPNDGRLIAVANYHRPCSAWGRGPQGADHHRLLRPKAALHITHQVQTQYIQKYNETQKSTKKRSEETQTLRARCSKAEPNIFAPPQTPFPEARDGQNLISWRWSLTLPTNPVW